MFDLLEVRKWDGEQWPENRVSIGEKHGDKHAIAITPKYADPDRTEKYFALFAKAPQLYDALEHVLDLWLDDADPQELENTVNATKLLLKQAGEGL